MLSLQLSLFWTPLKYSALSGTIYGTDSAYLKIHMLVSIHILVFTLDLSCEWRSFLDPPQMVFGAEIHTSNFGIFEITAAMF